MKKIMHVGLSLFLFCLVSTQGHAVLVSEWKFDGNAVDSAGSNDGTLEGNPVWVADRFGDPGKALALDGDGDYVNCGNDASLQITGDIPIEMWIKSDDTSKDAKLIATGPGSTVRFYIGRTDPNKLGRYTMCKKSH